MSIRVYVASKTRHAEMFRDLRRKIDGVYFTARWPIVCHLASEAATPASHWQQDNFDDASRSDFVMVYVEEGEHLKGGLVEVGVGLACGKVTVVVGEHEDYSKWQFHPLVKRAPTIEAAIELMKSYGRVAATEKKSNYSGTGTVAA